ncbi:hypothetical protein J8J40_24470, partial [Mycobacterium tuberculosis]|nr:hypothetical protein [Mycobacterium tuberculosis]
MKHWLPLFHERLETVFDYCPDFPGLLDALADQAFAERQTTIRDYYDARRDAEQNPTTGTVPYKPVPPDALYLTPAQWDALLVDRPTGRMTPFAQPEGAGGTVVDLGGRQGRSFA